MLFLGFYLVFMKIFHDFGCYIATEMKRIQTNPDPNHFKKISVADPFHFYMDPDPAPDPAPNPTLNRENINFCYTFFFY